MRISALDAAQLAFIPGCVEKARDAAKDIGFPLGNTLYDVYEGIRYARNSVYTSLAVSLIGSVGAAISSNGSSLRSFFWGIVGLGLGGTVVTGKDLYEQVLGVQAFVNVSHELSIVWSKFLSDMEFAVRSFFPICAIGCEYPTHRVGLLI
jgi:hypothetical protein